MTDSIFCLGLVIEDFIFLARSREQNELALVSKGSGTSKQNDGWISKVGGVLAYNRIRRVLTAYNRSRHLLTGVQMTYFRYV